LFTRNVSRKEFILRCNFKENVSNHKEGRGRNGGTAGAEFAGSLQSQVTSKEKELLLTGVRGL
jgi:hypothetical protein